MKNHFLTPSLNRTLYKHKWNTPPCIAIPLAFEKIIFEEINISQPFFSSKHPLKAVYIPKSRRLHWDMQLMIKWFFLSLGLPSLIRLCHPVWHPNRTIKVPNSPYADGKVNHPTVPQNHLEDKSAPGNDQRSIADEDEVLITEWQRSLWVWIYWKRWLCLCHASLKARHPKPPSHCSPHCSHALSRHGGSWEHIKGLFLKNQRKLLLFSSSTSSSPPSPLLLPLITLWPLSPSPPLPLALILPQDLSAI